ncbi:ATP-binding protein [Vibrio brasiliensis]
MRLTNMSIKTRLFILCLIPTLVIIAFSANQAKDFQGRLHSYQLVDEKNTTINLLTEFSNHLSTALNKRLNGQSASTSINMGQELLQLVAVTAHTENHDHHGKPTVNQALSYIEELQQLMPELESASPESTVEIGRLIYTVYHDLIMEVQSLASHNSSIAIHSLDLVLSDLSWLYYWMEREAWLTQEINWFGWVYTDYAEEYFRISERQQFYLDKFINLGADSEQIDVLLDIFASRDFQQGLLVKDRLLTFSQSNNVPEGFVDIIQKRNKTVKRQLIIFTQQLQTELKHAISNAEQALWLIAILGVTIFTVMFTWGSSTLMRINSKLAKIIHVMGRLKEKDGAEQIPVDGKDEFSAFASELNQIIEQQKEYEQKLVMAKEDAEAASRAKSIFLANMSHEIRTPLNGIIGMAEILSDSHLSSSQKEILSDIDTSSHALLVLINDILDLSKIESGNLVLSIHSVSLREMVFDTINMISSKALKQDVELKVEFADDLPNHIDIDDFRFKQVLMNLLSNAVKFTQQGSVSIEVAAQEGFLVCHVADSGVGISQEKLSEIFKPFTQEDGSITRRFGGTGLGLAICSQLVDVMQGTISVSSTLGVGSRFTVSVPLIISREQPAIFQLHERVLLVVNESKYRQLVIKETVRLGVELLTCETVEDTLSIDNEFSLVLYCISQQRSARQDLIQIRTCFPNSELIGLHHHLYAEPELEALLSAHVTLPVLGRRLESTLKNALSARHSETFTQGDSWQDNLDVPVKKVLIVEDNLMNQKIASFFLNKMGIDYTITSNGLDALNTIKSGERYCAILMDCMMPIMDGLTATKKIREWEKEQGIGNTPIIALTASVLPEEIQNCFDVGMDAYLPKPYKSRQLFETLERLQVTF